MVDDNMERFRQFVSKKNMKNQIPNYLQRPISEDISKNNTFEELLLKKPVDNITQESIKPVNLPITNIQPKSQSIDKSSSTQTIQQPNKLSDLDKLLEEYKAIKPADEQALENLKRSKLYAGLGEGLATIGGAIAGVKPTAAESMQRITEMPKLEYAEALNKPKQEQDRLIKLASLYKAMKSDEITPYQREALKIQYAQLAGLTGQRELNLEQKEEDRQLRREKAMDDLSKEASKDQQYNAAITHRGAVRDLESALDRMEQGDTLALSSIGTMLAKLYGEKGNLSESDVTRYRQAHAMLTKMKDYANASISGTLSKETAQSLRNTIKDAFKSSKRKIYEVENKYIKRAEESQGKRLGLTKDQIRARFAFGVAEPIEGGEIKVPGKETLYHYSDGTIRDENGEEIINTAKGKK